MDFYSAWNFLESHKIFNGHFSSELSIEVVKVNPISDQIDDDSSKNTKTKVWLEHGKWDPENHHCVHDLNLDCGGDTFEEAIIELAKLVKKYFCVF